MTVVLMVEVGITIGLGGWWLYEMRYWFHLRWALRGVQRKGTGDDHLDRNPRSALSLGRFRVVSVVAMERTAIVACRALEREKPRWFKRLAFAGPWKRRPTAPQWPRLSTTDQTMVLRVGDDVEALRAWALLEQWRQAGTILCLRPTAVPSTVRLSDDGQSTLQAVLSAD